MSSQAPWLRVLLLLLWLLLPYTPVLSYIVRTLCWEVEPAVLVEDNLLVVEVVEVLGRVAYRCSKSKFGYLLSRKEYTVLLLLVAAAAVVVVVQGLEGSYLVR
jgi:hypothetical protein